MKKTTSTSIMKKLCIKMILFVILFSLFALSGCSQKASKFSEEEHIGRVTERIQERYIDGDDKLRYDDKPTAFDVYPLYNENDELKYFLIEFEPYGFLYVMLRDEQLKAFSFLGASTSMYKLSSAEGELPWSRYTIDETNNQTYPDTDKCWETDENGKRIVYKKSPYSVTGVEDGHRYLLRDSESRTDYVPAIKTVAKFTNLISMGEVTILDGRYTKKQATVYISFIAKKEFDL